MPRLRFNIDKGQNIGGVLSVDASGVRVDDAGRAALIHLVMCQTASAREAAEYLGLRSIRAIRKALPAPIFISGEFRWWRSDLDAYADAQFVG